MKNLVQGKPFYTDSTPPPKQYPYLASDIATEVLIVGGGVTGALLTYYLTKANIPCVLVEKSRIGHGSTSITTALLQYELDDNIASLVEYTTFNDAINSYKLCFKALKDLSDIISDIGNNCDYKQTDSLLYTSKTLEEKEIYQEYLMRKENGIEVVYLNNSSNPLEIDIKGGILSNEGGAVLDPYRFTHDLLKFSEGKGARIFENTCVNKVEYNSPSATAITEFDYKISTKHIICATGYDTSLFTNKNFGTKYVTYNIVTSPLKDFDKSLMNLVIRDNNDPYNYLRMTKDHRLILGGEDEPYDENIDNKSMAEKKYSILETRLKSMFPSIADQISAEYKLCGEFISTNDNLGFIGRDENHDNLYYCLGYGANGILFSILGGQFLSKLFNGEIDPNMKLFNPNRK